MMIMKKIYTTLLVIIAAMLTISSCQKNEFAEQNKVKVQFFAEQIETKTAFGDRTLVGGNYVYPTLWTVNDTQVGLALVYDDPTNPGTYIIQQDYGNVTPSSDYTTAHFSGTFTPAPGPDNIYYQFTAFSPASAYTEIFDLTKGANFIVPSSQVPLAGSVDEKAQLLYAQTTTLGFPTSIVSLDFWHMTAYGKMSLTNLNLDGDETIGSVSLQFAENVSGRWYYSPDGHVWTSDVPSKTIVLSTTSASNIWFACVPVDMSNKNMVVNVCTNKGTFTKQITFPANRKFEAGKVSVFTVDMTGATKETTKKYALVTSVSDLVVGCEVIIAAKEAYDSKDWAISTTQSSNNRGQTEITKSGNDITNPSADVQIFRLEYGNISTPTQTYAFKAINGTSPGYLYAASSSNNWLRTESNLSNNSSWTIEIDAADYAATLTSKGGYTNNLIRHNTGNSLFSCYGAGNTQKDVVIYQRIVPTKLSQTLSFPNPTESATVGSAFTEPLLSGAQTPVTYSSSNTAIATVDASSGEVTLLTAGTTTITATAAETATYYGASASYILSVSAGASASYYVKVTSAPTDWTGTYLIVYETDKVAFNGSLTTLDAGNNIQSVTIVNDKIEATTTMDNISFTISVDSGDNTKWNIKSASDYYIGRTSTSNGLNSSKTVKYANTLGLNADGSARINGTGAYSLRFNSSSGATNYRFRYYTETTQQPIHLYKKQ